METSQEVRLQLVKEPFIKGGNCADAAAVCCNCEPNITPPDQVCLHRLGRHHDEPPKSRLGRRHKFLSFRMSAALFMPTLRVIIRGHQVADSGIVAKICCNIPKSAGLDKW